MPRESSRSGDMAAIWLQAIEKVDNALASSLEEAFVPPSALIDHWIRIHSNPAFPLRPMRRPPASSADISAAERRLGFALPAQVRELYESTDGVDWVRSTGREMEMGGHFPPVAKLVLAKDLETPLSARLFAHWRSWEEPDKPQHVQMYDPGVLSHVVDEPEQIFRFEELDEFLALQLPPDATCVLIAHRDGLKVPVGTVVEVENMLATRYDTLSHWMSAVCGMHVAAVSR